MILIPDNTTIFYDVDDTLIKWDKETYREDVDTIEFVDPYNHTVNYLQAHQKHVDLLKKHKAMGHFIVVWSQGGALWAKEAIEKLELEAYVDLIITKPIKFVDDLPAHEVLTTRIFLEDK